MNTEKLPEGGEAGKEEVMKSQKETAET